MNVACTAPKNGHRPGSDAERRCPVHRDAAAVASTPVPSPMDIASERSGTDAVSRTIEEYCGEDDPTYVFTDNPTVTTLLWMRDGEYHRDGGPAMVTVRTVDGTVALEAWYRNGVRHRTDGPAQREFHDGGFLHEMWYVDGVLSSVDDQPSFILSRPDGMHVYRWHKDDQLHREGGPAHVDTFDDGTTVAQEEWYREGDKHRDDGPAVIRYEPDGSIHSVVWYLDGVAVKQAEVLRRYIARRFGKELSSAAANFISNDLPWTSWERIDNTTVELADMLFPRIEQ